MSSIAEKYYGDRSKWNLVAKANPLIDPASMKIGTKLSIPPAPTAAPSAPATAPSSGPPSPSAAPSADGGMYTVASGDTLVAIARTAYGDGALWERIYEANKSTIGDDPAALKVGMKLVIPKK